MQEVSLTVLRISLSRPLQSSCDLFWRLVQQLTGFAQ